MTTADMDWPLCARKEVESWVKQRILSRSTFWGTFLEYYYTPTMSLLNLSLLVIPFVSGPKFHIKIIVL